MTREGAVAAAVEIDRTYMEPICALVQRRDNGKDLCHLRWMVAQMSDGMSENKTMRWLGYLQGIMVALYGVPMNDMKLLSARHAE